ncbi:hypothetical protein JAK31_02680 [Stenotrophomonas maltophilia]|uniref:hypothetical protein n=1 Tax=Stenotrophomonas maltophilia TaxID=40324 RepID=UPI0021C6E8B3|nr:hypothetical protein [Stenotrophomonas maltophilia]MCU1181932.1 hypothetical protein [Stenotrophomonas maltophilia]
MDALSENVLIGLGTGLVTGLVTGLLSGYYAGVVISRTTRFYALMRDAQRALKKVDYMQEERRVSVARWEPLVLSAIADDLATDRQGAAALEVRLQAKNITEAVFQGSHGQLKVKEFEGQIMEARQKIAKLRPSKRVLLPWGPL